MDAETRKQWRWKFYRVALHLNTVILFVALTFVVSILALDPYRIPAVSLLGALDIVLLFTFYRNYHATKTWLNEQQGTISEEKDSERG